MQIVIEIPKKVYNALTHIDFDASLVVDEMRNSITNGTPQKIGHWIDVAGGCECSECGCLEAGYSNFCPDCGVKMEVEE